MMAMQARQWDGRGIIRAAKLHFLHTLVYEGDVPGTASLSVIAPSVELKMSPIGR